MRLIAGHPDHAHHLALDLGHPEVVAILIEVGFVDVLDIGPRVVGRRLALKQPLAVEARHVVLVRRVEGTYDQLLSERGLGMAGHGRLVRQREG